MSPRHLTPTRAGDARFLDDDNPSNVVSEQISFSWRRSKALQVQADRVDLQFVREPNLDCPLVTAAGPVLRELTDGLGDETVGVILTSADGVVLTRMSSSSRLNNALDSVLLAPGYSYSEESVGTNGIGTALEDPDARRS